MIVYRVEHAKEGYGPYRKPGPGTWKFSNIPERHYQLPEPREERAIAEDPRYIATVDRGWVGSMWFCGFSSVYKLQDWFTAFERNKLASMGFVIAVYQSSADTTILGDMQLIFQKKLATKINQLDLVSCTDNYEDTRAIASLGIPERVPGGEVRERLDQSDVGSNAAQYGLVSWGADIRDEQRSSRIP